MDDEEYYIPVSTMNNPLILGIFDTYKEAIDASIIFLQKRDNFKKLFNLIEEEFILRFDKPFNLKEFETILFYGSNPFYSGKEDEHYFELNELFEENETSIQIHTIRCNKEQNDILETICSYSGWVNVNGSNQLESLIGYKFGYNETFNVNLEALAKEFPI